VKFQQHGQYLRLDDVDQRKDEVRAEQPAEDDKKAAAV